jgi:hypothetical protein
MPISVMRQVAGRRQAKPSSMRGVWRFIGHNVGKMPWLFKTLAVDKDRVNLN